MSRRSGTFDWRDHLEMAADFPTKVVQVRKSDLDAALDYIEKLEVNIATANQSVAEMSKRVRFIEAENDAISRAVQK